MSYGLTWLFLTLLMIGMSWSAAVSPMDETVLSSSDGDTSSTEVDIVALDVTETNTNNLIFEEEASEDDLIKPKEGFGYEEKPQMDSLEYFEETNPEYAAMLAEDMETDNQYDLLHAAEISGETVFSNTEDGVAALAEEETISEETTTGRAACTGAKAIGSSYYENFEDWGGSYSRGYMDTTDFINQGNGYYGSGKRWRKSTYSPSSGTGPSSAHSGSYFVYTEGSPYDNSMSIMVHDNCLDTSSINALTVDFWYHMYGMTTGWSYSCDQWGWYCSWTNGNGMKLFRFQVSDDQGASWDTIWSKYNNQGNSWKHTPQIDMTAYTGITDLAIRFTAQMTSATYMDDYALDDFLLTAALAAADTDGDGVIDDNDDCDGLDNSGAGANSEPTHPPNTVVGADGCPLDDDGDGVWNIFDECPFTPASLAGTADSTGCPLGFALPWADDFDNPSGTLANHHNGWFSVDESSTSGINDWQDISSTFSCVGSGAQGSSCVYNNWDYDQGKRWLVSPRVQVPTDISFGVELSWEERVAYPDYYQGTWGRPSNAQSLYVSEKACDPLEGDYGHLWTATQSEVVANANGGSMSFDISPYAGKSVCFAWVYDQYDGTAWYIDDVLVDLKTAPDDNDNDGVWDADADGNIVDLCSNSAAGAAVTPLDLTDNNNDGVVNYDDWANAGPQSATLGCQQGIPLPYSQNFATGNWMAGGGNFDGPAGFYNYNIGGGNTWKRTGAGVPGPAAYRPYSSTSFGVVQSHFVLPMLDMTQAIDENNNVVTPDVAYMEWEERGYWQYYYSNTYSTYNGIRVALVDRVANPLQECDPADSNLVWNYIDNLDAGDTNGDGVIDSKDNKLLGRHDGETGYPRSPSNTQGTLWQDNRIELTPYLGHEICVDFMYEGYFAHDWYVDNVNIDYDVIDPDTTAPYIADHWETTTLGYEFKGFVPYQGTTYRADARTMMIVLSDDESGVDNGQGVSSAAQAPVLHFQITAPNPATGEPVVLYPDAQTQAGLAMMGVQDPTWAPSPSSDASAGYSECSQDVPIPFTQTHTCLFYASLPPLPAVGTTMNYFWTWQDIGWKGANGLTHPVTGALLPNEGGGPNMAFTDSDPSTPMVPDPYSYTLTSSDYAADDALMMQMLIEGVNSAADTPAGAGALTGAMTYAASNGQMVVTTPQYYDVQMTYFGDTEETLWEYDMSGCLPYDMASIGFPGQNMYPGCVYGDITRVLSGQAPNGAQALLGAVYHPSADTYQQFTKPDNAGFPVFVPGTVTNWLQYYDADMDAMGVVALGDPSAVAGSPTANTGIAAKPSSYATTYSAFDVVDAAKPGDGYVMMDVPTGISNHLVGNYGSNTFEANSADGFNKMCVTSNSIFAYMDTDLQPIEMTPYSPCRSMAALGDFGFNGYGWAVAEGHFAYNPDLSYSSADNLWEISVEVNNIVPQVIEDFSPGVSFVDRGDGADMNAWDFAMTEDTAAGDDTLTYDLSLMRPNNDGLWWDLARGTDAGSCQHLDFFSSAQFGSGASSDDLTFSLIPDATTNAPNAESNSEIDWLNDGGSHQIQQQADGACNIDLRLREGPVRIHDTTSLRLQVDNIAEEMPDYHFDLSQPSPFSFENVMNVLPNTIVPVSVYVTNSGDDPADYDYDHELVVSFYSDDDVGPNCAGLSSGTVTTPGADGQTGTSDDGTVAAYECAFSSRTIKNPPAVGDTVRVDGEVMLGAGTTTVRAHVDVMTCLDDPCLDGAMAVPAAMDHTGAAVAQAMYISDDSGTSDVSYNPRNANLEDKDWGNNMADSAAAGIDLPNRVGLNVANSVPSFAPSLVAVGVVGLFVGVLINSSRREEDEEVLMEEDEMAVSPVIATILMVAITVVLSGIIYVWASQLANTSAKGTPMFTFASEHFDEGYWQITVQDSSDMELATQAVYVQVEWTVTDGPNAGEYVFEKSSLANNQGAYGFAPSNSESFITFLDSIDCTEDCTTMYGKDDNIRISTTDPDGYAIDSAIVTVSYEISSENYILRTFTATGGISPNIE